MRELAVQLRQPARAGIARKRATYESAKLSVVLCVDDARGCAGEEPPNDVVAYTKHIDATAVSARLGP